MRLRSGWKNLLYNPQIMGVPQTKSQQTDSVFWRLQNRDSAVEHMSEEQLNTPWQRVAQVTQSGHRHNTRLVCTALGQSFRRLEHISIPGNKSSHAMHAPFPKRQAKGQRTWRLGPKLQQRCHAPQLSGLFATPAPSGLAPLSAGC